MNVSMWAFCEQVVLTGGERGLLVFRWIATLTIADTGGRKDLDSVVDGGDDKDVGTIIFCIYV